MKQKWIRRNRRTVIDTPFMKVHYDKVDLPNGHVIDDYSVVTLLSGVVVIATDTEGRLITMHEYKYAIDRVIWNIPSGSVEDDLPVLQLAAKELMEETGYVSDDLEHISTLYEYPSKADHEIHIVRARNARRVASTQHEASETIGEVELLSMGEVRALLRKGEIQAMYVVAALALALPEVFNP